MRDIILLVSLVAVSSAFNRCGLKGDGVSGRLRSLDQVGKRQKIYGPLRQMAGRGEFPWHVKIIKSRLSSSDTYTDFGGTLIAKNWVLTAAHSVLKHYLGKEVEDPSDLKVRVGAWRQDTADDTEEEILVEKIIPHTEFDGNKMKNDIALIKLATNADCSSKYVGTACLPKPGDNYRGSENCWVTGWGVWVSTQIEYYPNELQKLKGSIQWDTFLKAKWGKDLIFPGMIGFKTQPVKVDSKPHWSHVGLGDSGGPLVCLSKSKSKRNQYDVVGIVSWGLETQRVESSKSDVFTSVTYFLNWIENNMK